MNMEDNCTDSFLLPGVKDGFTKSLQISQNYMNQNVEEFKELLGKTKEDCLSTVCGILWQKSISHQKGLNIPLSTPYSIRWAQEFCRIVYNLCS